MRFTQYKCYSILSSRVYFILIQYKIYSIQVLINKDLVNIECAIYASRIHDKYQTQRSSRNLQAFCGSSVAALAVARTVPGIQW
jgi:hypothetical protein